MTIREGSVFDCPASDGRRSGVPRWATYTDYVDPTISQTQYDYGYLGAMGIGQVKRCYDSTPLPAGADIISRTACQHGGPGVCPYGDATGYNWVFRHGMKKATDSFFYKPTTANPLLVGPESTPILIDKFVGRCVCHGTSSHCVSYVVLDRWQCTQMHPLNAGYYHPGGTVILYGDGRVAAVARLRPEDVRDTYWP